MNRHDRRAIQARARKTQQGLDQLGVAAQKLKGLEALPDALKDVQAILAGVNEARTALAIAIQDLGSLGSKVERLEYIVNTFFVAAGFGELVAKIEADYDAAHPVATEGAPVEPAPET